MLEIIKKILSIFFTPTSFKKKGLGAEPNSLDLRDIQLASFQTPVALPYEYETDITMLPVQDQKSHGSCFTAETLIQLANGEMRPIKDIIVGDEVIDAFGKKQIVTKLFHRLWQGNMFEIYPFGINLPIKSTPEHPFLMENGKFKEAKSLKTSDSLVIPVNREVKDKTDFWYEKDKDFLRVLGLFLAEGYVGLEQNDYRISFTMASHEEEVIDFISRTMYRIFSKVGCIQKEKNKITLRFSGKAISSIFKDLAGSGALNKRIHPKFLLLDPKLQYEIFYGWLLGDGSFKDKKQIISVSISKTLILQMFFISLRNDLIPSIRIRPAYGIHKEAYNLEFSSIDCNKIRSDVYTKTAKRKEDYWRGYFKDGNLVRRIRKIDIKIPKSTQQSNKNGKATNGVYNIETTGSHTYTANFVGVHNCVGQAEGTAIAYFDYLENKNVNISRRFIYAKCKLIDGIPDAQGTYPRVAGSVLSNIGATTGLFVPDDNSLAYAQYLAIPSDTALLVKDAKTRRANYANVALDLESIKQAIYKNKIITISLFVDWDAWRSKKLKAPRPGYIVGLHRVVLFGWKGGELFGRNSWSEQWGDNGNFSFDYNDYEGYMMDAIAYTDVPNELLEDAKNTPYTFTKVMRFGNTGAEVKKLQEFLGAKPADRWFGKITKAAVIRFQQLNGLVADGIVGPKTIEKLNKPVFMMTPLELSVMKQESGGDLYAIGDKTLKDKAYGCMQIRQPAVDDVNKALGKKMKSQECLGNINLSVYIFREYQKIYNQNGTDEEKARTWNGGPGWRQNPRLTDHYWQKVRANL